MKNLTKGIILGSVVLVLALGVSIVKAKSGFLQEVARFAGLDVARMIEEKGLIESSPAEEVLGAAHGQTTNIKQQLSVSLTASSYTPFGDAFLNSDGADRYIDKISIFVDASSMGTYQSYPTGGLAFEISTSTSASATGTYANMFWHSGLFATSTDAVVITTGTAKYANSAGMVIGTPIVWPTGTYLVWKLGALTSSTGRAVVEFYKD